MRPLPHFLWVQLMNRASAASCFFYSWEPSLYVHRVMDGSWDPNGPPMGPQDPPYSRKASLISDHCMQVLPHPRCSPVGFSGSQVRSLAEGWWVQFSYTSVKWQGYCLQSVRWENLVGNPGEQSLLLCCLSRMVRKTWDLVPPSS